MLRKLLTPRWVALHLVVLAVAAAMVWLGTWQWDRAARSDSIQSYSYAVEWVVFAVFTIVAYAKLARDELDRERPQRTRPELPVLPALRTAPPVVDPDEDPELAAYNAHLARLAESDRSRG